jgi:hypothetical protein
MTTAPTTLDALVAEIVDNLRFHHAVSSKAKLCTFAKFFGSSRAKWWRGSNGRGCCDR